MLVELAHSDLIQRIDRGAQMAARQMQVEDGVLYTLVPEQQLDRAQIGARFEQVCREAVPQGVITVLTISFPLRSAIAITRATAQRSSLLAI